jgi:hypothetical protein
MGNRLKGLHAERHWMILTLIAAAKQAKHHGPLIGRGLRKY